MEIPRFPPRRQGGGLPSIYIDDHNPPKSPSFYRPGGRTDNFSSPSPSPFSPAHASTPMSIPNASEHRHVPPPLPPPRFVPIGGPPACATAPAGSDIGIGCGLGSGPGPGPGPGSASNPGLGPDDFRRRDLETVEEIPNYKMRQDKDEGYYSMESRGGSRDFFGSAKFGLHHDHYQFKSSADDSSLKKLGMGIPHSSLSHPASSSSTRDPPRPMLRFSTLQPLTLPTRMKQQHGAVGPLLDSPNRYTETPIHSAVSPRSTPFGHYSDYSSSRDTNARDTKDFERSPDARTQRTNSSSVTADSGPASSLSQYSVYSTPASNTDYGDDETSFSMDESNRLRDFHLDNSQQQQQQQQPSDYHASAGIKRRASSPPGGDEPPPQHLYSMAFSEHLRWREGLSRASPTTRLMSGTQDSTRLPSVGSMPSGLSGSASSGRLSPGAKSALSPVGPMSPIDPVSTRGCTSPFSSNLSLALSPRSAAKAGSSTPAPHHRTMSDQNRTLISPPRRLPELAKATGLLKRTDFFMCDCCPKKPKKFESVEQLRAHEMEKQYECSYCGNRFKNKNEAERHRNSLHVRRHSWSCAALSSYDRAFHESTCRPGEADTCGYCGEEFMRSGLNPGHHDTRAITEQDWEERIRHLQDVHKFRECNSSKKFFRADHFRQHLKHSHAGTSGKWTNMLENACMMEEDPPMPMR